MIFGIGIDIVELHRIENMLSRQARFPQRILTEAEYARFTLLSDKRKIEFLAICGKRSLFESIRHRYRQRAQLSGY